MPDINQETLGPVSFIKGGYYDAGQIHLAGTFAYLPVAVAGLSDAEQVQQLGDVYFRPGISPGFTPASETYLSPQFRDRLASDRAAGNARRPGVVQEEKVIPTDAETTPAQPTPSATSQVMAQAGGSGPSLDDEDDNPADTAPESPSNAPDGEEAGAGMDADWEPFEGAYMATVPETRERLATMDDDQVQRFIAWEQARTDREPRVTLLRELGA